MTAGPLARFPLSNPAALSVFRSILAHGPSTRGDVAARTGLSAGAITKAVRPLLAAGLLEEGPARIQGAGRPVRALHVRPDAATFAGVKVTDDEVIAAIASFAGSPIATARTAVGSQRVQSVVATVAGTLRRLLEDAGVASEAVVALCATVSGDVDRERGVVRFSPFLGWRDVPLAALVEPALGIPTVIENDVRALALAESATGAGVGASPLVVITIGAGIGCGIVVDGNPLAGARGVSGELGHVPVGDPDVECYCGGRGCVEAVASDPAIVRAVAAATGVPVATVAEAGELARAGDGAALEVFARAGATIGRALAVVANLIGPERILVCGEAVATYDLVDEHVRGAFAEQAYGAASDCDVVLRPHSFEEWALGACAVARDAFLMGRTERAPSALIA